MTSSLAQHEALEVHELLTFKNLCLTKSSTMSALVQDSELKALIDNDVNASKNHIQQLENFLTAGGTPK
ncbi:hypothetical protein [Domibacillus epiphyticus]|uniref:Spore coat protein n=1 Tax=Domibacillus epiphyticus TaxID=1714355 RepID=A0A1V2A552_9BACI|nr:hypothetical protein [Domibacillus epiphyticus]OMP66141.1 hypothetical protein BTO28_14150 [Domibacillus epiphyticus]